MRSEKKQRTANIRFKEILKRRALFGNQTVVLLTGSGALTNSGASNPFFVIPIAKPYPNKILI